MIDLVQWRSSIGSWNSRHTSSIHKMVTTKHFGSCTNLTGGLIVVSLTVLLLILLQCGDIETNPGPPPPPTVAELEISLGTLVNWSGFGNQLPNIHYTDVEKIDKEMLRIDDKKRRLYTVWLQQCPSPSWENVVDALKKIRANTLASEIEEKYYTSRSMPGATAKQQGDIRSQIAERVAKTGKEFCLDVSNFREVYIACKPLRAQWDRLAIYLYIDKSIIDEIEEDGKNSEDKFQNLIDAWLRRSSFRQPPPSWRQLTDAVAHLDRSLSERIAQKHGDCDCRLCYRGSISISTSQSAFSKQQRKKLSPSDIIKKHIVELTHAITDPNVLADGMWSAGLITDHVHEDVLFTQSVSNQMKTNILLSELYHSYTVKSADDVHILTTFCNILKTQSTTAIEYVVKSIEHDIEHIHSLDYTDYADYTEALLKAAEEGTINTKWSKVSISGASGVGKTSLLKLLLNEEPPKVHDSTPVIQPSPLHVLEKHEASGPMQSHTMMVDDQRYWKEITTDDLYTKLAEHIPHQEKPTSSNLRRSLEWNVNFQSPIVSSVSDPIQTSANTTSGSTNTTHIPQRIQPKAYLQRPSAQKLIEYLKNSEKHGGTLGEVHFIHLLDTGGQACFIDIAPALVRFNSTNIFVHKLNEKLTDKVKFYFSVDNEITYEEYRNITNEQLLSSLVAARSLIKNPEKAKHEQPKAKHSLYSDDIGESRLLIIGTHHDAYIKEQSGVIESLKEKSECLLKLSGLKNEEELIFLDTTSRSQTELELAAKIRKSIINTFLENDIPIRWYLIHLEINEMKAQKMDVVALEKFMQLGKVLDLNKDEVTYALQYFHDLTVCLYFHEILPDVVFLSPNYLIDKLHKLICRLNEDSSKFSNGIYKKSHIRYFVRKHFTDDFLNFDEFIELLKYLFVIFPLPDGDSYFIGSILESHPDPSNLEDLLNDYITTCKVSPAVLMWPKNDRSVSAQAVPSGLFSSLCMALYQSSELKISHEDVPQFCNRITFNCQDIEGLIVLFQLPQYVGVAHTGRANKTLVVRNAVMNALTEFVEKVRWKDDIANPRIGFLSSIPQCTFQVFSRPNEEKTWLVCPEYDYHKATVIDKVYHLSWYPTKDDGNEKSVVHQSNQPDKATIEQPGNIIRNHFIDLNDIISDPDRLANELWSKGMITDQDTTNMTRDQKNDKILKQLYHFCNTKPAGAANLLETFCTALRKTQSTTTSESILKDIETDIAHLRSHYH